MAGSDDGAARGGGGRGRAAEDVWVDVTCRRCGLVALLDARRRDVPGAAAAVCPECGEPLPPGPERAVDESGDRLDVRVPPAEL